MAEARSQLQKSIVLDPVFGLGHAHYALLTALSITMGLLPNTASWVEEALGVFLLRAERSDEALAEARTSGRRDPKFHFAHVLEAAVLDRQGHLVEASASLALARQLCATLTLNEIALTHGRRVGEKMALLWK